MVVTLYETTFGAPAPCTQTIAEFTTVALKVRFNTEVRTKSFEFKKDLFEQGFTVVVVFLTVVVVVFLTVVVVVFLTVVVVVFLTVVAVGAALETPGKTNPPTNKFKRTTEVATCIFNLILFLIKLNLTIEMYNVNVFHMIRTIKGLHFP